MLVTKTENHTTHIIHMHSFWRIKGLKQTSYNDTVEVINFRQRIFRLAVTFNALRYQHSMTLQISRLTLGFVNAVKFKNDFVLCRSTKVSNSVVVSTILQTKRF